MNARPAAVGAIVVLAILVGAYIYISQPKQEKNPWAGKNETYMERFTDNLAEAEDIYLVMDLRGADEATRTNIMQCITDIAFSNAIGGKRNVIYSLDSECLRISEGEGEQPATLVLSECLAEIDSARGDLKKSIFYARKSDKAAMVFENELVIGINGTYGYMGCSISAESPPPQATAAESLANKTWERLTEGATAAGGNETGQ